MHRLGEVPSCHPLRVRRCSSLRLAERARTGLVDAKTLNFTRAVFEIP